MNSRRLHRILPCRQDDRSTRGGSRPRATLNPSRHIEARFHRVAQTRPFVSPASYPPRHIRRDSVAPHVSPHRGNTSSSSNSSNRHPITRLLRFRRGCCWLIGSRAPYDVIHAIRETANHHQQPPPRVASPDPPMDQLTRPQCCPFSSGIFSLWWRGLKTQTDHCCSNKVTGRPLPHGTKGGLSRVEPRRFRIESPPRFNNATGFCVSPRMHVV